MDQYGAVSTAAIPEAACLFPWLVFTGANVPTTVQRFPRGEAAHYREYAVEHGAPAESIIVEPRATNTAENLEYSRVLLAERQIAVRSVLIMSRPYRRRRAYATSVPDPHVVEQDRVADLGR